MGLDMVEFVMAVEDAFELDIANEDAALLRTPRDVIDHVHGRLPNAPDGGCLSQRAFYRVRAATCGALGASRAAIRPTARLAPFFDTSRSPAWTAVQAATGSRHWPGIGGQGILFLRPNVRTFGELADLLVQRSPTVLKRGDPGWSRSQVADVVHRLIRWELGATKYTEDSSFIEDIGVE